ncbi:Trp biosynthesis-associated membrane protein [Agromyces sp. NPDC055520]
MRRGVALAGGVAGAPPPPHRGAPAPATFWPVLAIVGGALLVLAGLAVLVTGGRWPASSRRYRDSRMAADRVADDGTIGGGEAGGSTGGSTAAGGSTRITGSAAGAGRDARPASDRAIDDWDGLSRGDDPTDDDTDQHRDESPGASSR